MPTVYITVPTDAASEIAETLVSERLAACVNQLATTSTYRWEGTIHREDETVLLAKTSADRYDDLVDRVLDIHPHDVPCIERFDEDDILEAFSEWRDDVTH
ncbi:divalent-cation tolerance protein CutA [Natronosalvus vescus]|uniref:divalent-cation tolerance protein CutA n=1 Tax=Natronosalvus vescus TaxID=2953881 RepID=UPI002090AB71|nr:divalent-cation tolerance protein CutA [Natronosalvus vescus]